MIKRVSSRIPVAKTRRPEAVIIILYQNPRLFRSELQTNDRAWRLSWSELNKSNMKYEFPKVYLPRPIGCLAMTPDKTARLMYRDLWQRPLLERTNM